MFLHVLSGFFLSMPSVFSLSGAVQPDDLGANDLDESCQDVLLGELEEAGFEDVFDEHGYEINLKELKTDLNLLNEDGSETEFGNEYKYRVHLKELETELHLFSIKTQDENKYRQQFIQGLIDYDEKHVLPAIRRLEMFRGYVPAAAEDIDIPAHLLYRLATRYDREHSVKTIQHHYSTYDEQFKLFSINLVIEHEGNVSRVAREIGIDRSTLRNWVIAYEKKHGIQIINTKNIQSPKKTHTSKNRLRAINLVIEYGGNVSKAAKKLGIPDPTLRSWVIEYEKEHGVQIRNKQSSDEVRLRAVELVIEFGGNVSKAARELGIQHQTLRNWVIAYEKEHGVQIRNKRYSDEFKLYAVNLVVKFKGNIARTAKKLGISKSTLRRWVRTYEKKL